MTIIINRNDERIAQYNCKRSSATLRRLKAIKAFYKGLYPTDKITAIRAH